MEWSFKAVGQALPPWREHAAMLTKWQLRSAAKQQGKNPLYLGVPFVGEWFRERGRRFQTQVDAAMGEGGEGVEQGRTKGGK